MAAKKNNKTLSKEKLLKENITDGFNKKYLFDKELPKLSDFESSKLAQAADNIFGTDSIPEFISPDVDSSSLQGAPVESSPLNELSPTENVPVAEQLSPEFFDGSNDISGPVEASNTLENEIVAEPPLSSISPISNQEGSPLEGFSQQENLNDLLSDDIIDIAPTEESSANLAAPSEIIPEDQLEDISSNEIIADIAPSEESFTQGPLEESIDTSENDNFAEQPISPEETLFTAIPEEGLDPEQTFQAQTALIEEESSVVQNISPTQTESGGQPEQSFSNVDEEITQIAGIRPFESNSDGFPNEDVAQNNIFQNTELDDLELARLEPTETITNGNPIEQTIDTSSEDQIQIARIAPEIQDEFRARPIEEIEQSEDQTLQIAEVEGVPTESSIEDYVEEMTNETLVASIKAGASPEEAAIEALKAGRDAARQTAGSPEEINYLAQNITDNLIQDINKKIENVQNLINEEKIKSSDETIKLADLGEKVEDLKQKSEVPEEPSQVAEATTEVAEEPSQVAEATTEVAEEPSQVAEVELSTDEAINDQGLDNNLISDTDILTAELGSEVPSINNEQITSSIEEIETITTAENFSEEAVSSVEDKSDQDESEDEESTETDEQEIVLSSLQSQEQFIGQQNSLLGDQVVIDGNISNLANVSSTIPISNVSTSVNQFNNVSNIGSVGFSESSSSILGQSAVSALDLGPLMGVSSLNISENPISTLSNDTAEEVLEEDSIEEDNIEEDTDLGQVTLNEIEEPETEIPTPEDDETVVVENDEFLSSTTIDDVFSGGNGTTQFLFDGISGLGGNDVISDIGTSTDDRIYIKNIGDNDAILFSRSSSNLLQQIEYFEFNGSSFESKNTISTPIIKEDEGIENIHLSVFDNEYDETVSGQDITATFEDFTLFGADNLNETAVLVVGDSDGNTFDANAPDLKGTFSSVSGFGSDRYDSSELATKIIYSKGGQDDINTSSSYKTIAFLGGGDDFLDSHPDQSGEPTASGSYFHGGFGSDEWYLSEFQDHIGISSTDYSEAFKATNKAILTEQGNAININSGIDDSYFEEFEKIRTFEGDDTFYFSGTTDNLNEIYAGADNDEFHFDSNTVLSNDFYANGQNGDDTFKLGSDFGASTLYLYGNNGNDQFKINGALTSNVCIEPGGTDTNINTLTFTSASSNTGLLIKDYLTNNDVFDFSSAAFSGNNGHALVFGHVDGQEFMPDSSIDNSSGAEIFTIDAFDETNNSVTNLLSISNDHWYYDTTDGRLWYDEDADQFMDDAIEIARVMDKNEIPLDKSEFQSSDIFYDYNSAPS